LHRLEERTLLLDDAVDRDAADFDPGGQDWASAFRVNLGVRRN
jgi:hypothetical protein